MLLCRLTITAMLALRVSQAFYIQCTQKALFRPLLTLQLDATTLREQLLEEEEEDDYDDDSYEKDNEIMEGGHVRSDLATSIWNWDLEKNHEFNLDEKFPFSTRQGLKWVDEICRDLLQHFPEDPQRHADLQQEGMVALMHSMSLFDSAKDEDNLKAFHRFEHLAKGEITKALTKALAASHRPLNLPSHVVKTLEKAIAISRKDPNLDLEQVASKLRMTAERLEFYQVLFGSSVLSMERTMEIYDPLLDDSVTHYREEEAEDEEQQDPEEGDDEMWVHQEQIAGPLRDFIMDHGPTPDAVAEKKMMQETVLNFLRRTLDKTELQVICMHYGLDSFEAMSREAIGKKMGISQQRVAQLEERAMQKLRTSYTNRYINTYLDEEEHQDIVDTV